MPSYGPETRRKLIVHYTCIPYNIPGIPTTADQDRRSLPSCVRPTTTLPHLFETRDVISAIFLLPPPHRNLRTMLPRLGSDHEGSLSWKGPAVLAAAVMEEEECEDGSNRRAANGRKRSREEPLRGGSSPRGCTMLLRYRRDVVAARTSNQYGAIGCRVFARVAATRRAATTNDPRR
ncbi:uncharacterized protein LOC105434164 [Pogonomyrmex barbatus]|uniref:Uncharacterized protein LOC105434164 n=1 Tax=Pogonomyrmex barbatus TaxID=144034 RepID=A0A6I9WUZ7_9HYME|nr:uncharacterized protein LOC105434164 [Pogonomyrmex barbatus]